MKKESTINNSSVCQFRIRAIKDTMAILSGKWKILIIGTLLEGNSLGFMDLIREVNGIGSKMLSKELQDLEMNQLVSRTVMDTKPITVKYALTEYGETLKPLIDQFANWGADNSFIPNDLLGLGLFVYHNLIGELRQVSKSLWS